MPKNNKTDTQENLLSSFSPKRSTGLVIIVIGLIIGSALLTAILFRPGSFTVVAQSRGFGSVEFKFNQSQVSLGEVLNALLSEQPGSQVNSSERKTLIATILRAHGFYSIPSEDAVSALRSMQDGEGTHAFMHEVRELLYDLEGPFAPPSTFAEARDARLLEALEDLARRHPTSPLVVRLWQMNLNLEGIFSPRPVKTVVKVDQTLQAGIAATCSGSPLLEKAGIIQAAVKNDEAQSMIKVLMHKAKLCRSPTAEEILGGQEVRLWISVTDMENLLLRDDVAGEPTVKAELLPEPASLVSE
jgi:hypothetical protein